MYDRVVFHGREALRLAAADRNPDVAFLWTRYNLSLAYYRTKNLAAARETARESLALFPDHLDAHFMLIVIGFDEENWEEVLKHGERYLNLSAALERDPARFGRLACCSLNEAWNIHILVGIAHQELGETAKAGEAFHRAETSAPDPFAALRAAGIYYARKGLSDRARHYLEKARRLQNGDETVRALLADLDRPTAPSGPAPTISACLIVKDEEAFLENCLKSIKDWVDEIIVVDTGSTDRTVEIARRFTGRVYFHPWRDSFSEARNTAMGYATGDWILTIDADEELVSGSGELLRRAVREAGDADAIYANVISVFSGGRKTARHNSERLLRNNGVIRYEGRVHNRVAGVTKPYPSKVELMHYGYNVEEKKAQEKFFRTVALLKAQVADNPENPMPHHYLGTSYLARGMYKESLEESLLAIDLAERSESMDVIYLTTHHNAALAFFSLKDLDGAREYSLRALKKYPDHLDSLYMMTLICGEREQWAELTGYGRRFLVLREALEHHPERAGVVLNSSLREGGTVHMLMGHAHHALGDTAERDRHYRETVRKGDEKWRSLLQIGLFHTDRSGDLPLARRYLDLARQEAPDEPAVWFMLSKWHHHKGNRGEEKSCLRRLWELGTEDPAMLNRLATLSLEANDLETAERALTDLFKVAPDHLPGLCNLAVLRHRLNDPAAAVSACERAIAIDPKIADPWLTLGEVSLSLGDPENAASFFKRVLALENGSLRALLYLCEADLRRNDLEGFIGCCDRLLAILDLPRERTLHTLGDLTSTFREIQASLAPAEEFASQSARILSLLPGSSS
jgi:tetratricopeptide (TPR) repeat protein